MFSPRARFLYLQRVNSLSCLAIQPFRKLTWEQKRQNHAKSTKTHRFAPRVETSPPQNVLSPVTKHTRISSHAARLPYKPKLLASVPEADASLSEFIDSAVYTERDEIYREPLWSILIRICGLARWHVLRYNRPGQYVLERIRERSLYPEGRPPSQTRNISLPEGPDAIDLTSKVKRYWQDAWKEVYHEQPDLKRIHGELPFYMAVQVSSPWNDTGAKILDKGVVFARNHPLGRELLNAFHHPIQSAKRKRSPWPKLQVSQGNFKLLTQSHIAQLHGCHDRRVVETLKPYMIPGDHKLVKLVEHILHKIAQANGFSDIPWEIYLVNAPYYSNADAWPSGKIFIYSGILASCNTEAGLALLIAHEMAHVICHHSERKGTITAPLAIAMITFWFPIRICHYIAIAIGKKKSFQFPKEIFRKWQSRQFEYEADALGLLYHCRAGYDPEDGMEGLQKHLITRNKDWIRYLEKIGMSKPLRQWYMSTHPSWEKRLQRLQDVLPKICARVITGTRGRNQVAYLLEKVPGGKKLIVNKEGRKFLDSLSSL